MRTNSIDINYNLLSEPYLLSERDFFGSEAFFFLKNSLYPYMDNYHSPYTPVFLAQEFDSDVFSERQYWQARDGKLSLANFFSKSSPVDFPANLIIDSELAFVVPSEWRTKVAVYQVKPKIIPASPTKLLVCLPLNQMAANRSDVNRAVQELSSVISSQLDGIDDYYLFARGSQSVLGLDMIEFYDWALGEFKSINPSFSLISWDDIVLKSNLCDFFFYEINPKRIYADSFIEHFMLSRGAQNLRPYKPNFEEAAYSPLSLYHGLSIGHFPDLFSDSSDLDELVELWTKYIEYFNF